MSHIFKKTKYTTEGSYASTDEFNIYVHHNLSSDCVTFYDYDGDVLRLAWVEWGDCDMFKAIEKLMRYPYDDCENWTKEDHELIENKRKE